MSGSWTYSRFPTPRATGLDPSWMQRKRRFYSKGRVVDASIPELAGNVSDQDKRWVSPDWASRNLISKPRKYVIVEVHIHHSLGLPITSFSHRGNDKPSASNSELAPVFTNTREDLYALQEQARDRGMLDPIKIVPEDKGNQLKANSLVDFGKIVTIDHNNQVGFYGDVCKEYLDTFMKHYSAVREGSARPQKHAGNLQPALQVAALGHLEPAASVSNLHRGDLFETGGHPVIHDYSGLPLPPLIETPESHIHKYIQNSGGQEEERDPSYEQRPYEFFSYGAVICLLSWDEFPADSESIITDDVAPDSANKNPVLRNILWLVVVQEGIESCKCLRILTYEGRGVGELPPDLEPGDHSIIYTGREAPGLCQSEVSAGITEKSLGLPIRVRQDNREEMLYSTARILWTRVYDVKTDVKAKRFGSIPHHFEGLLENQFKKLNPNTSIDVTRPTTRQQVAGSIISDPFLDENLKARIAVTSDTIEHEWESDEGSEQDTSSGSESPNGGETTQTEKRPQIYRPGEEVYLMLGKEEPDLFAAFVPFRINDARLKVDGDEMVWEYNLRFTKHNGEFMGGMYFEERLFMPTPRG